MFTHLLYALRAQGLMIGMQEWLTFLRGIQRLEISTLQTLYALGRTILCRTETDFDSYDQGFVQAFEGIESTQEWFEQVLNRELEKWLDNPKLAEGELVEPSIPLEDLLSELQKRLEEQTERHDGGNYWIGTGGRSPFGHSGRASHGIRLGGASKNRSAVSFAAERKWRQYRTDSPLDIRDIQLVLKQLRQLTPMGDFLLNIDSTIHKTVQNGGEIELDFQREKKNRLHLVLLLDSGGSMEPYARMVEQFFSAFSESKGFKTFQAWHFHNVPYGRLFSETESRSIPDLLNEWTVHHRVVWVGDACMAPYELLSATYVSNMRGLDWILRIQEKCPKSIWLNPEARQFWNHPTIRSISQVVRMFPLSIEGLQEGIRTLR